MIDNFFGPKTIVGEMSIIHTDLKDVPITVKDTYGILTGFHKNKETYVIVDPVAGTFTIKVKGSYKFAGFASLAPSAGMIIHFAVFVKDAITDKITSGIDFKNTQNTQTFSANGWLDLNVGDVVTVRGMSDTVPVTVRINHMNINIFREGP